MNFILRRVIRNPREQQPHKEDSESAKESNYLELNEIIGDSYNLILKSECPDEFFKILSLDNFKDVYEHLNDQCFAFLSCKNGSDIKPLFYKSEYYIMTESGKTFSKLQ